jgi:hypothetical protein
MSATHFLKAVARPSDSGTAGVADVHRTWRSRLLAAAALAAVAWSCTLLLMDVGTSNPRLVSRDQVLASDAVVIGRLGRPVTNIIKVERVFSGNAEEGDELQVVNLREVPGLAEGTVWLMPLSAFRNDFVVTTLDGQKVPPLVYEPTPGMVDQVKTILRERL